MSIIPFARHRFTPADVEEFMKVARPRMEAGLWAGFMRESSKDGDSFYVFFSRLNRPIFKFHRTQFGDYLLWFHNKNEWMDISRGETAQECLGIWGTGTVIKKAS